MATLTPNPKQQFLDANGNPLAGGKVYTYAAGTTTPLATYTDSSGTVPNTNPIILDSRGEANVWLGSSIYKFKLTTSTDVEVWTVDNISTENAAILSQLAASNGSNLIGFLQSGANAVARTAQNKLRDVISVKDFGAVGDGVTDDTAAIQACLNAATAYSAIQFPGVFLVTSTITVTSKNNLILIGGTIKTTSNITALQLSSCTNVDVSLDFVGSVNTQQYEVVLNNSNGISDLFNSYTQTELITNTAASANATVSKSGSTVTVALTGDAGLTINRGALSSAYSLDPTLRYAVFINRSGFSSGIGIAAPRFYVNSSEWNPQYSSGYNYISGSTFQIKVGTGRWTHAATYSSISGYTGAAYNIDKISLAKLVNESATYNFAVTNPNAFLIFSGCTGVAALNCSFKNGYGSLQFTNCEYVEVANNTIKQCFTGINITTTGNAYIHNNYIDMRWTNSTGDYLDCVFFRNKGIFGSLNNKNNFAILNNVIYGANWGMEFTSTTDVYGATIANNKIYSPRISISVNKFKYAQINNNYCISEDAFCSGFIETADISENITISGNTCIALNICGQSNTGVGPSGNNYTITGNTIRAAIPVIKTGTAGPYSGITISNNDLQYGNTGLFIRELYANITDNSIRRVIDGYVDGVTYSPVSMCGLQVQFTANDSGSGIITIRENEIDGSLSYLGVTNCLRLDMSDNFFKQDYNPTYGFYGDVYASATSSVGHTFAYNRLYSTGGYNPRSQGFIRLGTVPAAGGSCVMKNQNADMNTTQYSGAGTMAIYDGAFGGGAVTWTPGTIANGGYAETTVAGVYGAFGCAYSVAPPYDIQGCIVYAYFDGTNTKLRIQNNTGGSVTFGSGNWKVMADRSRY